MSNAVFPSLVGQAFPVKRTPNFNTIVQQAASGREVRVALREYPLWDWDLPFDWLSSTAAKQDWQTLVGFFLQRQGSYDSFLFSDPDDSVVTDQLIGLGDGVTKSFQLIRTLGGFNELVTDLNGAPTIKDNGVVVDPADYSVVMNASGILTFTTAPVAGHTLTWSGGYYWRVRFATDSTDFSKFAYQFWENQSVQFSSARS